MKKNNQLIEKKTKKQHNKTKQQNTKQNSRPLRVNIVLIPSEISLQALWHIIDLAVWLTESVAREIYVLM